MDLYSSVRPQSHLLVCCPISVAPMTASHTWLVLERKRTDMTRCSCSLTCQAFRLISARDPSTKQPSTEPFLAGVFQPSTAVSWMPCILSTLSSRQGAPQIPRRRNHQRVNGNHQEWLDDVLRGLPWRLKLQGAIDKPGTYDYVRTCYYVRYQADLLLWYTGVKYLSIHGSCASRGLSHFWPSTLQRSTGRSEYPPGPHNLVWALKIPRYPAAPQGGNNEQRQAFVQRIEECFTDPTLTNQTRCSPASPASQPWMPCSAVHPPLAYPRLSYRPTMISV